MHICVLTLSEAQTEVMAYTKANTLSEAESGLEFFYGREC